MDVSLPLLSFGIAIVGLGLAMFLISMKPREAGEKVKRRATGVFFIGFIPVFFSGKGKWFWVSIAITVFIMLLYTSAIMNPRIIGW